MIHFFYEFKAPWRELEYCFIGPGILRVGDAYLFSVGLLFVEFGIRIGEE